MSSESALLATPQELLDTSLAQLQTLTAFLRDHLPTDYRKAGSAALETRVCEEIVRSLDDLIAAALSSALADSVDESFGDRALVARELIHTGAQVRTQLPSRISSIADVAELVEGVTVIVKERS
jgi:hypothetical protein